MNSAVSSEIVMRSRTSNLPSVADGLLILSLCGGFGASSFCDLVPGTYAVCSPGNITSRIVPHYNSMSCNEIGGKYCQEKAYITGHTAPKDYILYIFLDSLPVLIWVPLILFFNIDLASGPGHSLVFMYQVLVALSTAGGGPYCPPVLPGQPCRCDDLSIGDHSACWVSGFLVFYNVVLKYFWRYPTVLTITHYSLDYVKILIAGVLVAVSFFLTTCTQCPLQCCRSPWAKLRRAVRNWRERHLPQHPVLTGACSVVILMYGSLVEVSFRLLYKQVAVEELCHCNSNHSVSYLFCSEHTGSSDFLCWGSKQHLPYFIPAWIMVSVAVLLSLPFFYHPGVPALASYLTGGRAQLPRLHKLAPLFDVFQGVYKPKMQFFTGLHLLYRIGLFATVAFGVGHSDSIDIYLFVLITILAIHSLFQPYKKPVHNYFETLLLINTTLVNVSIVTFPTWAEFTLVPLLVNLPLFFVVVYCLYGFLRHCCCHMGGGSQEIDSTEEIGRK